MLYIVEIQVSDDELTEQMSRMRVWLDHRRSAPNSFRFFDAGEELTACRVHFICEDEAIAFAREFGGHVIRPPVTDALIV